ncbi:aldose reductase-related protein 2-like [Haliotis rubra]|uniref:aldose reductase-related protein 2-like n=1 Tax=Haliotis rubra TaxID=36100 RepID=UPI001EE4F4F3|nr:aldose reductase-related protein 2-like [Haliotis rubra]
MPLVGLGSWQVTSPEECKDTIRAALDAGYRHIDTAYAYQNEAFIGEGLQEYFKTGTLKREDIFVTTKETGKGEPFPLDENNKPAFQDVLLTDTWKGMEQVARSGQAKSIGVSNFNMEQTERICKIAEILPATNQVECHLYLQQEKLFQFLREGITVTAYSPFGSPTRPAHILKEGAPRVLDDPVAKDLATKYKRSVGQILLRYLVQRGMIVIPKSSNPSRILENVKVFDFELSGEDMSKLSAQDKKLRFFNGNTLAVHSPKTLVAVPSGTKTFSNRLPLLFSFGALEYFILVDLNDVFAVPSLSCTSSGSLMRVVKIGSLLHHVLEQVGRHSQDLPCGVLLGYVFFFGLLLLH